MSIYGCEFFNSFTQILMNQIAKYYAKAVVCFIRSSQTVFQSDCISLHSYQH